MNKPRIRFKGFEGEWKERRIGDICNVSTGKSNTQDKVDDGKFPFYVRSPHIEKSNKYLYDEEAVLTVGDGVGTGKVFHYVNGKYDLHQRVYRLYDFKGVNALCFYYYFSQKFYKRVMAMTAKSSVDSVRLDFISEMHLPFPSLPEQRALASYFTSLDAQIAASTSRLSSLKQIKAASLLNMFPQKGETVPRVRFKGFQGEWKEIKLGEIFSVEIGEFVIKTKQKNNAPYPVYNGGVSNTGFYDCYNQEGPKIIVSARGANAGYVNYCTSDFWAGNSCYSIGAKNNDELKFFFYLLKRFQEIYMKNQYSASIPSISKQQILRTNLMYPSLPEQRAIASYFTALDAQITLHRERLEKLKQIKAACLEKMFA